MYIDPKNMQSIKKVQVGCGPHNLLKDWCNIDIRNFPGIDIVMDVTKVWPWKQTLEYIFGEHFIEHLEIENAIYFLVNARNSLTYNGKIRLSTPSLEWVMKTHFSHSSNPDKMINDTIKINRAFHGWGHRFLYSKPMLTHILSELGYEEITFHKYGQSGDPTFNNLERHGGYSIKDGTPSVWIVEAVKGMREFTLPEKSRMYEKIDQDFIRHVKSGH